MIKIFFKKHLKYFLLVLLSSCMEYRYVLINTSSEKIKIIKEANNWNYGSIEPFDSLSIYTGATTFEALGSDSLKASISFKSAPSYSETGLAVLNEKNAKLLKVIPKTNASGVETYYITFGSNQPTESSQINLSNWNAESENVTSLSVLLEDEGIESSPTLMNNNTLLFESIKNDNADLWTINLNKSGGIIQLTTYDGPDRLPSAHPDGKKYVFLSDRSNYGLYLGEFGKPTVMSLVEVSEPYIGTWTSADISPDGERILYVSGKYIWMYDLVNKTKTQFVQGSEPKWSPDGEKIIYRKISKVIEDIKYENLVSTSIWMMNNDGTEQTEIINGTEDFTYSGASISPDYTKIVYVRRKIDTSGSLLKYGNTDIWICDIDGTGHTQITTHPLSDKDPIWRGDRKIIFISDRPQSGKIEDQEWNLWQLTLY